MWDNFARQHRAGVAENAPVGPAAGLMRDAWLLRLYNLGSHMHKRLQCRHPGPTLACCEIILNLQVQLNNPGDLTWCH